MSLDIVVILVCVGAACALGEGRVDHRGECGESLVNFRTKLFWMSGARALGIQPAGIRVTFFLDGGRMETCKCAG